MTRLLLLGGTSDAAALARLVADAGLDAVYSYAGRTAAPAAQPLPLRTGGFGGIEGLAAWLAAERITHVIDATHPFAAGMSRNAVTACAARGLPLLALERPGWREAPGDRWIRVPDLEAAARALPETPARVFLGIGRQQAEIFACRAQHHYLLRRVDPGPPPPGLPDVGQIVARGPFDPEAETRLLAAHRITHVVSKDSGGTGAVAKLTAARRLGLPVILAERPAIPARETRADPQAAMDWLEAHGAGTPRGV
ncbi:cobalt-precorrin-6A reductase [Mangrovicoccus algicola]|uniref:Cobalt-precorrin-6A reductase n=1 Tax=Mangrovicoccus algicola TaxID=2771008 RepID=A0A8J6YZ28_9RHOB|nr:cobalt-precorrin-6A reductase [Mangrovicoccus algicola]MBE3640667.1 cobalt-precorrin-6A reductase [Mangrovicoccus algicola]